MIHRTKLNIADTWSEEVEARLITSWQTFQLLYDVADKRYLNHVLENAEVINMTGSVCGVLPFLLKRLIKFYSKTICIS